jgi:hypothetical protein
MAMPIFTIKPLFYRLAVDNPRETQASSIATFFPEYEDVLPCVQWKLVLWRAIPVVIVSLSFNLAFMPNDVGFKPEPHMPKYLIDVSTQTNPPFAQGRHGYNIVIIKIIKNII